MGDEKFIQNCFERIEWKKPVGRPRRRWDGSVKIVLNVG
jgi:hypothetical protein